jgi:expansin (peptidoglycan-binding protein)
MRDGGINQRWRLQQAAVIGSVEYRQVAIAGERG